MNFNDQFSKIILPNSNKHISYMFKPVYNDHTRDSKIVPVVDRWSFLRGMFMLEMVQWGSHNNGR